jgi:regulator of replication initiation timing
MSKPLESIIQDLQERITELETEVNGLRMENQQLRDILDKINAQASCEWPVPPATH